MTQCRNTLGHLRCVREGGHAGPHRQGMTVWGDRLPAWLERAKDAPNGLAKILNSDGAA